VKILYSFAIGSVNFNGAKCSCWRNCATENVRCTVTVWVRYGRRPGRRRGRKSHCVWLPHRFSGVGRAGVRACPRSVRLYVSEVGGLHTDPRADSALIYLKNCDRPSSLGLRLTENNGSRL